MIGGLPKSLEVGGEPKRIRSDFRIVLLILEAFADPDLNMLEKVLACVECLYEDIVEPELYGEAYEKAIWFIDGGNVTHSRTTVRLVDWVQDESLIFPAINKVAQKEVRGEEYLHWWTFLGYFTEIGESGFSTVLRIRQKLAKGQQLEKWERDYYRDNVERIKLKTRYNAVEEEEMARLNTLFS